MEKGIPYSEKGLPWQEKDHSYLGKTLLTIAKLLLHKKNVLPSYTLKPFYLKFLICFIALVPQNLKKTVHPQISTIG